MTKLLQQLLFFSFAISMVTGGCQDEQGVLNSFRAARLTIEFDPTGGNAARRPDLVRNGIPVEITVWLDSSRFETRDVTRIVEWQYEDGSLGRVIPHSDSKSGFAYFQDSTGIGSQVLTATFEGFRVQRRFDVSPVETVFVEGDEYRMGSEQSDEEFPPHNVRVGSFSMGKFEITNEEFNVFLKQSFDPIEGPIIFLLESGGDRTGFYLSKTNELVLSIFNSDIDEKLRIIEDHGDHPVRGVTWKGAMKFTEHYGLRLPFEAEWEFAAKRTSNQCYPNGEIDRLSEFAVFNKDITARVGSRKDYFELHDMYGNVMEWCWDFYGADFYKNRPLSDLCPKGPINGFNKVLRGGAYKSQVQNTRASSRDYADMSLYDFPEKLPFVGFRVVRETANSCGL